MYEYGNVLGLDSRPVHKYNRWRIQKGGYRRQDTRGWKQGEYTEGRLQKGGKSWKDKAEMILEGGYMRENSEWRIH